MYIVDARNVADALVMGMQAIEAYGVQRDSRNGPVKVFDCPVTTIYRRPTERVLFFPERDANPFFHFMEGLWMLAGRRDVQWISQFNSTIDQFSDDGILFHGAYGFRWRGHFEASEVKRGVLYTGSLDQLETIANLLKRNPDDRRIVLQMWDPSSDLGVEGKDFPCNLCITFRVNPYGALDMTVFNRSNDMIWGAYGANAVHMSMLQEVMAAWIGKPVGKYYQISTNFHSYVETWEKHKDLCKRCPGFSEYEVEGETGYPMVNGPIEDWFSDLEMFLSEGPIIGFKDKFFRSVASPMYRAWEAWKQKDDLDRYKNTIEQIDSIVSHDWQRACREWILRRKNK